MLDRLLHLLQAGKPRRLDELADALHTTAGLVEAMIEDLVRLGYLAPLAAGCSQHCAGCPLAGACCASEHEGRAWVLTEKGAARRG
jgi:hypothetical protein